MRLVFMQGADEARHIETAGASHAQRGLWHQVDACAGQDRRVHTADIFQQGGQRQHAQMALDAARRADPGEAARHRELRAGIQAHALGLAGGARGVGDLDRARRQRRHRARHALEDTLVNFLKAGDARGHDRVADQGVDAGTVEHMRLLLRREESGHRHAHPPAVEQRQVPGHPVGAVVERQRHPPRAQRIQARTPGAHVLQQLRRAQLDRRIAHRRTCPARGERRPQDISRTSHARPPSMHRTVGRCRPWPA